MRNFFTKFISFFLLISFLSGMKGWGQSASLPISRTAWASEPTGWGNSGCTQRTSTFACTGNDATTFDTNGDSRSLNFTGVPNQLVFQLKRSGMSGESKLVVEESSNGTSWSIIGTYGTAVGATTITDCSNITLNLTNTTRYIRWTYTKATGNCDMDEVSITCGTPTLQSSSVTNLFSTIGTTSVDINWTNGNGTTRLVFVKATNTGTPAPVDGTTYSANPIFGNGSQISTSGWFCVYNGTATSVTVTGLVPGTEYRAMVVEANCLSTNIKYLTSTSTNNPSNQTTSNGCSSPTTQAGSITPNSITTVGSNFSFTRGNGDNVLVVARLTSTGAVAPTSGNSYTADASFGSGTTTGTGNFIIYNGTATGINTATGNLPISNLTAGTSYTLTAYEYSNTGTCYNTTSPGTGTILTLCTAPTASAASSINTTSFTANWGSVTGASSYRLDVSTANDFTSFVAGYNDLTVAGTSQNVTGLVANTTYYYRVRAINSTGSSANSSIINTTTLQAASQLAFGTTPPSTGNVGVNLTSFTVEARRPDNSVDNTYTSNITIAKATGTGNLTGTLTVAAVAGVATFNAAQFDAASTYTLTASSGVLTTVTSGNIVISPTSNASDHFRSNVTSGNWATVGSWESSSDGSTWYTATLAPTNAASSITIRNGHTITVAASATARLITVAQGSILTLTSSLSIADASGTDLTVNGTLNMNTGGSLTNAGTASFSSTGIYNHQLNAGTIPTATWNVASNCNVAGMTSSAPSGLGQTFGNFTWNCGSQSSYVNIQNNSFSVAGTLTIGPSSSNLFSFANTSGTFTNAVGSIAFLGGIFNIVGSSATVNLNVTNDVTISGGELRVESNTGTANFSIGRDLIVNGTGYLNVFNNASAPSTNIQVTRNLSIAGTGLINLESVSSSSGVSQITVGGDFSCSSTNTVALDFGTGTVGSNRISIAGNFSYTGSGVMQTTSSSAPSGFVFTKNGTQTFTFTGNSNISQYVPYTVNATSTLQLQNSFTLGTSISPASTFNVLGTLSFQGNTITAANTTDPRFLTSSGATLITSHPGGIDGSLSGFGSFSTTAGSGVAQLVAGVNYTFNGATTTPFSNGMGNPSNITVGANVTLNRDITATGTVTLNATLAIGSNTLTLNGPYFAGTVNNLTTTSSSNLVLNCTGTGPFALPNFTAINNLTVNSASQVYNLNSSPTISGTLTLASGTLSVGSNTLTLAGIVSRTSGFLRGSNSSNLVVQGSTAKTLHFDQGTDGSHLNPTTGTNSLGDLTLNTSGNLVLGNKVNLYGTLTTATGTTLNTDDGFLVFRNTATTTARVADLTDGAGSFSGTVRSEMYLHAQRRAWRFITNPTPTTGGTIANNWQSNFGHASNYGTNIYSPSGTGFDGTTVSASMMKFNPNLNTTGGYDNVTNTGDLLDGTYFMFVRGDKTVTAGVNNAWVPTTLASKGDIKRGTQTIDLNGLNGRYGAIPNPFLSPVDVSLLSYTGIAGNNASYHWDPSLGSFGGWVSINNTNWSGISDFRRNMQIGQSALVLMNSATASVVFEEADKVSTKTTQQTGAGNGLQDNFKTTLFIANSDGSKTRADEMFVAFKNGYNPNFDGNEDAVKMNNNGENLSSKRNNTLIAIEARPYIQNSDSVFMNFTNTRVANYEFEFDPSNFDATVTSAKLVDKFLNSETPISLSTKTTVPFSVTATTGSNAADRFMVVFNGTGALPNRGFTVSGEKLGTNKVRINWEAVNEFGVKHYELEHSTDGRTFSKINTQVGKNGNVTNNYTYTDNNPTNGVNYYRIKTTQNNDIERYSNIITINLSIGNQQSSMVVYPNPVKGNVIGLQLQDLEKGMYSVRLLSIEGKEVYKQQLQVSGNSLSTTISPSTRLAQGTYTLQVVGKNNSYTQKVVVE